MSAITIKTHEELELMREAGRILGLVHENLAKELHEGMSTLDVDTLCEEIIRSYDCEPNFKGLYGFPGSVCISVNDEVVHGIPHKDHILEDGMIVSLDTGVLYKGYHSDAARTVAIGEIPDETKQFIERTRQSFFQGMKYAKAGKHLYDISGAIGDYAISFGYGVVKELVGHGIGKSLHEEPNIPNYKMRFRKGPKLKAGMTFAIEPMINMGSADVCWAEDEWTVLTLDESLSAHYENTVIITDGEPEILTLTPSELANPEGNRWI